MHLVKSEALICDRCGGSIENGRCSYCGPWGIIVEASDLQKIAGQLTIRVPNTPDELFKIWGNA